MSVAEKLTTIAENQQKVYDAGYAAGQAEGGGGDPWQGLRDLVASKTQMNSFFAYSSMAEFPSGLDTSNSTSFNSMFANCTNLVTSPVIDTAKGKDFTNMYNGDSNLAGTVELDLSSINGSYTVSSLFQNCGKVEKVILKNARGIVNLIYTFFGCKSLVTIEGSIDLSATTSTNNAFARCDSLKDIRFVAGSIRVSISFSESEVLSNESTQSILDGLADLTGVTTQTLTLHKNIVLTDEQKATISSKNWTLVQ